MIDSRAKLDKLDAELWHFQVHDSRIDHRSDSYAIRRGGRVLLIDPLLFDEAHLEGVMVEGILLTGRSHERHAYIYRRKLDVPIAAPAGTGYAEPLDIEFRDDTPLPWGIVPRTLLGPKGPHASLTWNAPSMRRIVFSGDLLMPDEKDRLRCLPAEHVEDLDRARTEAHGLFEERIDILCCAHGGPLLHPRLADDP